MRIISGKHRGRRIQTPAGNRVRPTADMVREAIFDVLQDIDGWNVLDLFAGSGAVGIEALSRGAGSASFVDNNRKALKSLQANVDAISQRDQHEVHIHEATLPGGISHVNGPANKYDMIFVDPPYSETVRQTEILLPRLEQMLNKGGVLVIEGSVRDAEKITAVFADEANWKVDEVRRYGDTAVCLAWKTA